MNEMVADIEKLTFMGFIFDYYLSSVNLTKSSVSCGFGQKKSIFCAVDDLILSSLLTTEILLLATITSICVSVKSFCTKKLS